MKFPKNSRERGPEGNGCQLRSWTELKDERQQIEEAILSLERLARGRGKRRGRPPAWLAEVGPKRRGRPPGSKNKIAPDPFPRERGCRLAVSAAAYRRWRPACSKPAASTDGEAASPGSPVLPDRIPIPRQATGSRIRASAPI